MGSDGSAAIKGLVLGAFQSTLPRGERQLCVLHLSNQEDFNPRSRVGSDQLLADGHQWLKYFNPRSRVGSDLRPAGNRSRSLYFNPRSRVGSDLEDADKEQAIRLFQSTLPRGERRAPLLADSILSGYFNPRSRVGSDPRHREIRLCARRFQSTLPRGERPEYEAEQEMRAIISIHAPAWGATRDAKIA